MFKNSTACLCRCAQTRLQKKSLKQERTDMSRTLTLAVPSDNPGGLTAGISAHFGHCDMFTLISIQDDQIASVNTVNNVEHSSGGCMGPVNLLREQGVQAIVVGGIGARPMQFFAEAGIEVYYADRTTLQNVGEAANGLIAGKFPIMRPDQTCQGDHSH
jgi:predicted Fe-Mo cluster-binding NifX family protein